MNTEEIEYKIKAVDVVLRLLRAQSSANDTVEGKLEIMKCARRIESIRSKLRKDLFESIDANEALNIQLADSAKGDL